MGEVLDFSKFEKVETKAGKTVDERIVSDVASILRTGKSRNAVKILLRDQGYSLEDAERIVSKAELKIYTKPEVKLNFPVLFLGFIAIVAVLGLVAYFFVFVSTGAVDCAEDTFCVQKIVDCQDGKYKSSYRGTTNEYQITNQGSYCQVFVRVLESSSTKILVGMNMNCLYPISDGKTDLSRGYLDCDGSLALAFKP